MKINAKQLASVIRSPSNERYKYFIKIVAGSQEVWGLHRDGWALAATDDGTTVFPIWPAKEYAVICSDNEWAKYKPMVFSLNGFMTELLPKLKLDGVLPGVFFTPGSKGVTPSIEQLLSDLEAELQTYYG